MTFDVRDLNTLDASDALLISALLDRCEIAQMFVETKLFRRDNYAQIKVIDRLEIHGYLIRERVAEKEFYRVSLMAMVQLPESPVAREIMVTAELVWKAFRKHYEQSLDLPITLGAIADLLGQSIVHVTRVHMYMQEWWNTPICFTPAHSLDPAVTVREDVLGWQTFAACVQRLRELQAQRIQFSNGGFLGGATQLEPEPKVSAASAIELTRKPSWMEKLPTHAQSLLREIYAAMDAGLFALAAMGVRAVIDVVSDDILGAVLSNFYEKLQVLHAKGHLTSKQFDVLKAVVEAGHAAAHRAYSPDQAAAQLMIDSLEHLLYSAYELDGASFALSSKTPPRPSYKK